MPPTDKISLRRVKCERITVFSGGKLEHLVVFPAARKIKTKNKPLIEDACNSLCGLKINLNFLAAQAKIKIFYLLKTANNNQF